MSKTKDKLVTVETAGTLAPLPEPPQLAKNPAAAYLARLAEGSRPAIRGCLGRMAHALLGGKCPDGQPDRTCECPFRTPWEKLTAAHVALLDSSIKATMSPNYANQHLAALRGILKAAWRLELISQETLARLVDIPPARARRAEVGRCLSPDEVQRILQAAKNQPGLQGARDAALVAILFGCGLRRTEVTRLRISSIVSPPALQFTGKGKKDRKVPLPPNTIKYLGEWLAVYQPAKMELPLIPRFTPTGKIGVHHLATNGIWKICSRLAWLADVKSFAPHDARRTYATRHLENGTDLIVLSELMGHASIRTTIRYDRRGEQAKYAAVGHADV